MITPPLGFEIREVRQDVNNARRKAERIRASNGGDPELRAHADAVLNATDRLLARLAEMSHTLAQRALLDGYHPRRHE